MTLPAVTRKTIPIPEECLRLAENIRVVGSPQRNAIEETIGDLPEKLSESQAVAAMLSYVEKTISEKLLELEYEDYAAATLHVDEGFSAANRARRARRAGRRAGE